MCRILGFKSSSKSNLNYSLKDAENSIHKQSHNHADGWGIAYYTELGKPFVDKHTEPAYKSFQFSEFTKKLNAETIITHIRKATFGSVKLENCHPFQHGEWIFAHNGTIENFEIFKPLILNKISTEFKSKIGGDTDSEHIFYLFLTNLSKLSKLDQQNDPQLLKEAIIQTVHSIDELNKEIKNQKPPKLNIILSNQYFLVAICRGETLYYHQHLPPLPDSKNNHVAPERKGIKKYVIVVSEKLSKKEKWNEMQDGSILIVDQDINCEITSIPQPK